MDIFNEVLIGIITTIIGLIITNNYWNIMMYCLPDFVKIKIAQNNFKKTQGIGTLFCEMCHSTEIEPLVQNRPLYRCCHCKQGQYFSISNYNMEKIENVYRKKYKIKSSHHFLTL